MQEASSLLAERRVVADYRAALELYWHEGWTDGLPIVPPTEELVAEFLRAGRVEPEDIIGELPLRYRVLTAEKLAINAVMAGCRAEYFPVVIAIWKALLSPEYSVNSATASTSGGAPLTIINGPIRKALDLRSGGNLLGPGNRANATIGRSVSLTLINVLGATGPMDRACIGHPGKYSYCVAEDEDDVWEPLHVQRGFGRQQSTVTVVHLEGPQHVREAFAMAPEMLLNNCADHVKTWNQTGVGVLIFNPDHRGVLQEAGWDKGRVAEYVFEQAVRTVAEAKRAGRLSGDVTEADEATPFRLARGPEDFMIIAGGSPGIFSAVIPPWAGASHNQAVTAVIDVPS